MTYIFKQKLNLSDLVNLKNQPKRILIHEPHGDLAALYAYYLKDYNFEIKHCGNLDAIQQCSKNFSPHLLIFNVDEPQAFPKIILIAKILTKELPDLNLISTGYNLNGQELSKLMALGVNSHLNRKLSRPQDLAVLVTTILN